ncbi:hypothetical protein PanWU01x14_038140, partial [Parasponia andersonii]
IVEMLKAYLIDNEFDSSYTNYIFHGEVIEIHLSCNDVHVENVDLSDEMMDILRDFIRPGNVDDGENEDDMGDDMVVGPSVSDQ